jgi:PQQ-dependent catabolism-associated CXXCW motif protein
MIDATSTTNHSTNAKTTSPWVKAALGGVALTMLIAATLNRGGQAKTAEAGLEAKASTLIGGPSTSTSAGLAEAADAGMPSGPNRAPETGGQRSYLGVEFDAVTPQAMQAAGLQDVHGAIVSSVAPGSPAAAAGIQAGDFVIGLEGQAISSVDELASRGQQYAAGQRMVMNLLRVSAGGPRPLQAVVTLGSHAPAAADWPDQPAQAPAYPTYGGNTGRPEAPSQDAPNFADERTDFGVAPQNALQAHVASPTPVRIPGAGVITTEELKGLLDQRAPIVLIDALNDGGRGHDTIPGAAQVPFAGQPGSFNDELQQDVAQAYGAITRNNRQVPVVFFCMGSSCWEGYNAALRATHLGYTQVLWYRGGLSAWRAAGLPLRNPERR